MFQIAHFEVYCTSLASGSVLLLITVTRYRKICKPLEPGLTVYKARVLCGIIVACTVVLCSVTFVINGTEKVWIKTGEREMDYVPSGMPNTPSGVLNAADFFDGTAVSATVPSYPNTLSAGASTDVSGTQPTFTEGSKTTGHSSTTFSSTDFATGKRMAEVVEVYICRTSESQKGTVLYYILQALLMLAFTGIFISLIILHCFIARSVVAFERRRSSMRRYR
jgi:hypothetical protein